MDFSNSFVDLDCSLSNPAIVVWKCAFALLAAGLGARAVALGRSRIIIVGTLLVACLTGWVASGLGFWAQVHLQFPDARGIGCIGEHVPWLFFPSVSVGCFLMISGVVAAKRAWRTRQA
jgi:hypothetical protein